MSEGAGGEPGEGGSIDVLTCPRGSHKGVYSHPEDSLRHAAGLYCSA
jgi:hypothetical protein